MKPLLVCALVYPICRRRIMLVAHRTTPGAAPAPPPLTADSMQHTGVPAGTLSEPIVHVSRIYDGMRSSYRIYVPAQYDPKVPAALMVFQDGSGYAKRDGDHPALKRAR